MMDYKTLLSQVQKTITSIEGTVDHGRTIVAAVETIATNFRQLGITGGRLYELRDGMYELVHRFGESTGGTLGILVPQGYRPVELTLEQGAIVMEPTDPGVDPVLEGKLGARRFAAISVGDDEYILSFNLASDTSSEDVIFSLNLVRQVLNTKLRNERFELLIGEAQRIQQAILPHRVPSYPGYDLYGRAVPAERVGGDFYDFIPLSNAIMGVAIADASGHGLPAALIVRDIYMGLRMGVDRDFKIVRTVQKLNNIIHQAKLTTKFISMFYGELETNGTFLYTNAGHNPPFVLKADDHVEFLTHGGPVLGPKPDAIFNRGYAGVKQGDVLCLYTDGIIEATSADGEEFGTDRLIDLVRSNRHGSAQEITGAVFEAVERWAPIPEDDRTVVIVKAVGADHAQARERGDHG
jgi:phosphoserine phosphatase RsbU/P